MKRKRMKRGFEAIRLSEVKHHLKVEKAKLASGMYAIGSKEYNAILDRASLLLEIIRRKQGEKAYKRELKKVIDA